jgi:hypothetical protein
VNGKKNMSLDQACEAISYDSHQNKSCNIPVENYSIFKVTLRNTISMQEIKLLFVGL